MAVKVYPIFKRNDIVEMTLREAFDAVRQFIITRGTSDMFYTVQGTGVLAGDQYLCGVVAASRDELLAAYDWPIYECEATGINDKFGTGIDLGRADVDWTFFFQPGEKAT